MPDRSLPRLILLAALAATSVLAACGVTELADGMRAGKAGRLVEPSAEAQAEGEEPGDGTEGLRVVPGTEAEAQALVEEAERRFLEGPSADFQVQWTGGGLFLDTVIDGRFDAEQPAAQVVIGMGEDDSYELRLRGEDTWIQVTVGGRSMDCWMHLTGGAQDGGPAGVPYQALLLLEPVALGRKELTAQDRAADESGYADVGERVVVELRLDEVLPAVLPLPGGAAAKPLDPEARVRAVANVGVNGRYTVIEVGLADVLDALESSRGGVPKELRGILAQPALREVEVEIDYNDYGSPLEVQAPPRSKVADFGSWSDLLAGIEDPAARTPGSAPSCAAAMRGA